MKLTRDEGFPAEAAHLVALFNSCCTNSTVDHVVMASANMLAAAIISSAKAANISDSNFPGYADEILATTAEIIVSNWGRTPEKTDIAVRFDG